ncbi:MAG: serine/threonine-protein kinase [Planctomycetota bacterium]
MNEIPIPGPGAIIAGRTLVRAVGEGAMGVVFETRTADGATTALKLLKPSKAAEPRSVEEFRCEAEATGAVDHECVVTVLGTGHDDGFHWIEMEFVDGPPLSRLLKKEGRLPWRWSTKIVYQVAQGLKRAHELGLIHRDVKPDNVLVFQDGRIRLTDFGIVKDIGSLKGYLLKGRRVGTAQYASPEQCLDKRLSTATDMYSLGATWFHIVCGRPPFLGETNSATMKLHCTKPPPAAADLVDDLPKPVANLIGKMLSKKQADRVPTMDALLADLKMILKGKVAIGADEKRVDLDRVGTIRRTKAGAAPEKVKPRIPPEYVLVGVALLAVLVFVVLMILR